MNINFLSIFIAALVPLAFGFVWYHDKVFLKPWMAATGMTKEKMNGGNMLLIFGGSFLCALMLAFEMNVIAYHDTFVRGVLFYETAGTMMPDPNSTGGQWLQTYLDQYAASNHTFKHGAFHGAFIAGIFIVLPVLATEALHEQRGWKFVAIKAGYWIISLSLMGGIVASMA